MMLALAVASIGDTANYCKHYIAVVEGAVADLLRWPPPTAKMITMGHEGFGYRSGNRVTPPRHGGRMNHLPATPVARQPCSSGQFSVSGCATSSSEHPVDPIVHRAATNSAATYSAEGILDTRRVAGLVRQYGFALVAVDFGQCADTTCHCHPLDADSYTYTIGLADHNVPELLVTGLSPVHALQLTTHVNDHARRGQPLAVDQAHWLGDASFMLRNVSGHWLANDPSRMAAWFTQSGRAPRSGQLPQVVQIVWGDAAGRFPRDALCDPFVSEGQPVVADDPFGFPRRTGRPTRCHSHVRSWGHRRTA